MSELKAYILNRFAKSNSNYTSWMDASPIRCSVVDEFSAEWEPPSDAGIIVTHMHYRWEEIATLRRVYERGRVPILILADGILEYRNTWENPGVADGSVFQPLLGHKLACIGKAQARSVESWGNAGKCEVVGLPRLNEVQHAEYLPVEPEGPFRLLVATANTPAFTEEQRSKVINSLRLIKTRAGKNGFVNGRPLEITWRLTDGLAAEIGMEFEEELPHQRVPLSDAIELADAVITTPSTLYLESVMKRRPTAILDFCNTPMYVNPAWLISAPSHLNQVLNELANPAPAKMLFQRAVMHDNLEMGVNSKSRLYSLMTQMVKAGVSARKSQTPINLPTRILSDPQRGIHPVEAEFNLATLYRDNPTFKITDVHRLQQELNHAIARLGQLPRDLDAKHAGNQLLAEQLEASEERIREGLQREQEHLALVDEKTEVIAGKSAHIDSLEKLLVQSNERSKGMALKLEKQNETIKSLMEVRLEIKTALDLSRTEKLELRAAHETAKEKLLGALDTTEQARLRLKTALDNSLENSANMMNYLGEVKKRLADQTAKAIGLQEELNSQKTARLAIAANMTSEDSVSLPDSTKADESSTANRAA